MKIPTSQEKAEEFKIINRTEWGALPPKSIKKFESPVNLIFVDFMRENCSIMVSSRAAMANPRPLKLLNVALLQSLKNRYFGSKLFRSLEKVQILALKMTIFQKCGAWADLGWPWL
jgi:hypothetical protein